MIPRMLLDRPFPNIDIDSFPGEERDHIGSIRLAIGELHARARDYWASFDLYRDCLSRQIFDLRFSAVFHKWQICAARDAMMSIYHYGMLIEGIDESLSKTPVFQALVDTSAKRKARKGFEKTFSDFHYLRHAIAHSAERAHTVASSRKHGAVKNKVVEIDKDISIRLSSEASFLVLNDMIKDGYFISMWKGKVVRCPITEDAGTALDNITDQFWAAFSAVFTDTPEPPPTISFGN